MHVLYGLRKDTPATPVHGKFLHMALLVLEQPTARNAVPLLPLLSSDGQQDHGNCISLVSPASSLSRSYKERSPLASLYHEVFMIIRMGEKKQNKTTSKASLEGTIYGHGRIAVGGGKRWIELVLPLIPEGGVAL